MGTDIDYRYLSTINCPVGSKEREAKQI